MKQSLKCSYTQGREPNSIPLYSLKYPPWYWLGSGVDSGQAVDMCMVQGLTKILAGPLGNLHFSFACGLKLVWTSPEFSQQWNTPWKISVMLAHWSSDHWNLLAQTIGHNFCKPWQCSAIDTATNLVGHSPQSPQSAFQPIQLYLLYVTMWLFGCYCAIQYFIISVTEGVV